MSSAGREEFSKEDQEQLNLLRMKKNDDLTCHEKYILEAYQEDGKIFSQARNLQQNGEFDTAIPLYKDYIERNTDSLNSLMASVYLGHCYAKTGNREEAIKTWREAIESGKQIENKNPNAKWISGIQYYIVWLYRELSSELSLSDLELNEANAYKEKVTKHYDQNIMFGVSPRIFYIDILKNMNKEELIIEEYKKIKSFCEEQEDTNSRRLKYSKEKAEEYLQSINQQIKSD